MNKVQLLSDISFTKEDETCFKLLKLSTQCSKVTLNISEFLDVLKSYKLIKTNLFEPVTERRILETGFYGTLDGMEIHVSKTLAPGEFLAEHMEDDGT